MYLCVPVRLYSLPEQQQLHRDIVLPYKCLHIEEAELSQVEVGVEVEVEVGKLVEAGLACHLPLQTNWVCHRKKRVSMRMFYFLA